MGAILPFVLAGAFQPNDIEAMSLACEEVCNALHINGDVRARETIAVRVIELARSGDLCPTVLRDRVLAEANAGTECECGLVSSPGGRQQPAPHEFADGRRSAGETILESELVDRR